MAMDSYYGDYKPSSAFFDLPDFIRYAATSATDFYNKLYQQQYAQMRADGKKDEVIAFSNDFLLDQILRVEFKDGEYFSTLEKPVMSFVYDESNVGVQNVFPLQPRGYELERSDIDELWQFQYWPVSNRISWALDGKRILYVNRGKCNLEKVKVIYVPSITGDDPEVELPDGIVYSVISQTVGTMRGLLQNNVLKKASDYNENKTIQSEIDKNLITP